MSFLDYVCNIPKALDNYECIILEMIESETKLCAKMLFRGLHKDIFFGVDATNKIIEWYGAAFFSFKEDKISELWVLGDIDSIKSQLK